MSNEEMLIEGLQKAISDLYELEPGSQEYIHQCEAIKIFNDIVREREKAADEYDEKNSKEAKKERRIERFERNVLPWLSNLALGGSIMLFEGAGNFVKTKAFGFLHRPK